MDTPLQLQTATATPLAQPRTLPASPSRRLRTTAILAGWLLAVALVVGSVLAAFGGAYREDPFPVRATVPLPEESAAAKLARRSEQKIRAVQPRATYIVVDTYRNRLRVFRNGNLEREAICSTGSGVVLRDPRDGRQWVFDTPVGERTVQRKVKDPIWAKPDWAFIEDGYAPPRSDSKDRYDDFSLGKYGLYMGDGYIIHGTIFQTLLGQRVTHGCIRLGDADLEWVYQHVPLGAKVYLY